MSVVDVPLCINTANPQALKAALKLYDGKTMIKLHKQRGKISEDCVSCGKKIARRQQLPSSRRWERLIPCEYFLADLLDFLQSVM